MKLSRLDGHWAPFVRAWSAWARSRGLDPEAEFAGIQRDLRVGAGFSKVSDAELLETIVDTFIACLAPDEPPTKDPPAEDFFLPGIA